MDLFDIAVAKKLAGGGGGGNPNTMQVITGTLSDPFGEVDIEDLATALQEMNASALFEADASSLGAGYVKAWLSSNVNSVVYANGGYFGSHNQGPVTAFVLAWEKPQGLILAKMSNDSTITDISSYATIIPATLTIIRHPLP